MIWNPYTSSWIDPESLPHVYGQTGANLTSDTVTNGTHTWVKTYTYSGSVLLAESIYVLQE